MASFACTCFDGCGSTPLSSRGTSAGWCAPGDNPDCLPPGCVACLTCGGALNACGAALATVLPDENTKIYCNLVPEATCEACVPHFGESPTIAGRFGKAARTTIVDPTGSRYVAACFVYFAYATGVILIDM